MTSILASQVYLPSYASSVSFVFYRRTVITRLPYHLSCYAFSENRLGTSSHRSAACEAHDGRLDVFRCQWSRVILVLD